MHLRLKEERLDLDSPVVMGILNVTPDSFSDGGEYRDVAKARERAAQMLDEGAQIIDIGGESTRPGAESISPEEEIDRLLPVVEYVARTLAARVSVDTSKAAVMCAAVDAGAVMINDVYALRRDGALQAAAELETAVCLMHMQGEPRTMQDEPEYDALPDDVIHFLERRVAACREAGIADDRIAVDPGFGFGKDAGHNLEILANLDRFRDLGLPLLVGLSRKRTLGSVTGRGPSDRVSAGLAAAVIAVLQGAHIVRTHDVAATVDALRMVDAVRRASPDYS